MIPHAKSETNKCLCASATDTLFIFPHIILNHNFVNCSTVHLLCKKTIQNLSTLNHYLTISVLESWTRLIQTILNLCIISGPNASIGCEWTLWGIQVTSGWVEVLEVTTARQDQHYHCLDCLQRPHLCTSLRLVKIFHKNISGRKNNFSDRHKEELCCFL